MGTNPLRVEDTPDLVNVAFLEDRLYEFNVSATGVGDGRWLAIFVRDQSGLIAAGLHGWTWGGCLFVRTLWVREDRRRQGDGTRLMRAAEAEAVRRGCRKAMVDTDSFQAPGFYMKLGYEVVGEVEGYFGAMTRLQLRKRLD